MAEKDYKFNAKQLKKVSQEEANELFDNEAISKEKVSGVVSSPQVKQIVITNVLPPIEEQIEGVLYGIYVE